LKKLRNWAFLIVIILLTISAGYWYHLNQKSSPTTPVRHERVMKKEVNLVAIGDSLTYGQGDESKNGGYVGIIKQKIKQRYHTQVNTVNYGVSGDRSDQILDRINKQKKIRNDIKHADVITMTVGGNDLMQTLQKEIAENQQDEITSAVNKAGQTYQQKLVRLFTVIRRQNHQAPIFVVSIYNPVYAYFANVTVISRSVAQWNKITEQTVSQTDNAYFVDINHLMSYGQYKTSKQRQQLIDEDQKNGSNTLNQKQVIAIQKHDKKNLNQYISPEDNFHPNHKGYEEIAKKLFASMKKHNAWLYQTKRSSKH
jgi:lysophospholipase L1-like esterase